MAHSMLNLDRIMKPEPKSLAGRRVLVVGLGRFGGGVGVTRWLASQGATVTVTDQAARETLAESVAAVADVPVTLHLGGHDEGDLDAADLVIINPAVNKSTSAFFQAIVRRGLSWTTEMNLFCERCPAKVLGVTGSYGKSTTCAMLAEAMEACRRADKVSYTGVHLGGNIGRSLLNDLPNIRETDWVVLEMSNAQLEDLPRIHWAPDVAVITNLFPHHLDRYARFEDYIGAKLNITRHPERYSKIVVGELHSLAEDLLEEAVADRRDRVIRVPLPDPAVELRVPGHHNHLNAACALTACSLLGLNQAVVRSTLRDFRGLPHRLEFIRTLDGVDYYNDSKSTAPAATVTALEALVSSPRPEPRASARAELHRKIIAIVGGQRKDVSRVECAISLARYCRVVIGMGESGPDFADAIKTLSSLPPLPSRERVGVRVDAIGSTAASHSVPSEPPHSCGGFFVNMIVQVVAALPDAVRLAHAESRPGEVVLFSPGAPSFDQYANFTDRGRHFNELVQGLCGVVK